MIFRQFFERRSCSYSYLLADRSGGQALLVDPVRNALGRYRQALRQLGLQLIFAIDTHSHHDRLSGLPQLYESGECMVLGGEHGQSDVHERLGEGERIRLGELSLYLLFTPGHTADSYSLVTEDRVFGGDTLLIRSVGRSDLLGGDAAALFESLHGKLLRLPDNYLVFPAHDFQGWTATSIEEERWHNPYLQIDSEEAFVAAMAARRFADHLMTDDLPLPE